MHIVSYKVSYTSNFTVKFLTMNTEMFILLLDDLLRYMKLSLQLEERDMFHVAYRICIKRTVRLLYLTIKIGLETVLKSFV